MKLIRNKKILILISLLLGLVLFVDLRSPLDRETIECFAGCYFVGKSPCTSYDQMTKAEIEKRLKDLDLSRKKFEKIKNKCIKKWQRRAFVGCSVVRGNEWKNWEEMDEEELKENLDYFGIEKEDIKIIKKGCY